MSEPEVPPAAERFPDSEEELGEIGAIPPSEGGGLPNIQRVGLESGRLRHQRRMYREATARWLGVGVLITFAITIAVLLAWGWWVMTGKGSDDGVSLSGVMEMGKMVLPYLGTALGFALGYYFSGRGSDEG